MANILSGDRLTKCLPEEMGILSGETGCRRVDRARPCHANLKEQHIDALWSNGDRIQPG